MSESETPVLSEGRRRAPGRLLAEKLASLGVTVEREVELSELAQDDGGVEVTLTGHGGRRSRERFAYVLGCDGAHSTVRHRLGLAFPGGSYQEDFFLADCRVQGAGDPGALNLFLGRWGVLAVFPLEGARLSRIIVVAPPGEAPETISLDDVRRAILPMAPRMALSEPRWVARFRLHHRAVDHYRRGRVFLCGDAAHIHSPAGGQGMNTGLQDAQNLAWKLGLLHRGEASERILDSYHAERFPVGQVLLRTTDRFFRAAATTNPFLVYPRNWLVPLLTRALLVRPQWRRRIFRFVSQLAIHYRGGPLADETGSWPGGPAAGERAPDGPFAGGWLFEHLGEPGFRLLAFGPDGTGAETLAGPWRTLVVETGREGELAARYGVKERALYLVRPDGYVGWRAPDWDSRAARRYFADRLGWPGGA